MKRSNPDLASPPLKMPRMSEMPPEDTKSSSSSSEEVADWCGGGFPSLNAPLPRVSLDFSLPAESKKIDDVCTDQSLVLKGIKQTLERWTRTVNRWQSVCAQRTDWSLDDKPPAPPTLVCNAQIKWKVQICHDKIQPADQKAGWNVVKHYCAICPLCDYSIALVGNPTHDLYDHTFTCMAIRMEYVEEIDLSV